MSLKSIVLSGLACIAIAHIVYLYYAAVNLQVPEHYFYNTSQFAASFGYGMQEYNVTTLDGGTTTIFRLFAKGKTSANKGPPAIMVQGLFGSSDTSIIVGPEHSLVYTLADKGIDVWLFNDRTAMYFRSSPTPPKYKRFGLHEVGIYDVPAVVDFVSHATGYPKVSVVTHSCGAAKLMIALAERPEYNQKIAVAVHLCPTTWPDKGSEHLKWQTQVFFTTVYNVMGTVRYLRDTFQSPIPAVIKRFYFTLHVVFPSFFNIVVNAVNADISSEILLTYAVRAPLGQNVDSMQDTFQCTQKKDGVFLKSPNLQLEEGEQPFYDVTRINSPTKVYYIPNDDFVDHELFQPILKRMPNVLGEVKIDFKSHAEVFLKSTSEQRFMADLFGTLKNAVYT